VVLTPDSQPDNSDSRQCSHGRISSPLHIRYWPVPSMTVRAACAGMSEHFFAERAVLRAPGPLTSLTGKIHRVPVIEVPMSQIHDWDTFHDTFARVRAGDDDGGGGWCGVTSSQPARCDSGAPPTAPMPHRCGTG